MAQLCVTWPTDELSYARGLSRPPHKNSAHASWTGFSFDFKQLEVKDCLAAISSTEATSTRMHIRMGCGNLDVKVP